MIGVYETWSNETYQNVYGIKGSSQVNNCRLDKRRGVVFLFINESFQYCKRDDLSIIKNCIESVFVDISPNPLSQNKCVTIGVIYRPPNIIENIAMLLANLKQPHNNNRTVYIMGDFNLNLINVTGHIPTSEFVEPMFSYSVCSFDSQTFTETSASHIDDIYCNSIDTIPWLSGIIYINISDHFPIFTILSGEKIEKI